MNLAVYFNALSIKRPESTNSWNQLEGDHLCTSILSKERVRTDSRKILMNREVNGPGVTINR